MSDRPTPRTEAMIVKHSEEDDCCGAITLCRQLEREADELREALQKIAKQKISTEMDEDDWRNGDFEGAYEAIILVVRAALNNEPKKS